MRRYSEATKPAVTHHFEMVAGGFKGVELNARGWAALVGVGAVPGALLGEVAADAWLPGVIMGVVAAFVAARLADALREPRRYHWLAVEDADEAQAHLRRLGIPIFGATVADVRDRRVDFVAVRDRDLLSADRTVGLARDSRRGQRRWANARRVGLHLPPPSQRPR